METSNETPSLAKPIATLEGNKSILVSIISYFQFSSSTARVRSLPFFLLNPGFDPLPHRIRWCSIELPPLRLEYSGFFTSLFFP